MRLTTLSQFVRKKERFMSENVFGGSGEGTSLEQPRAFNTIVYGV